MSSRIMGSSSAISTRSMWTRRDVNFTCVPLRPKSMLTLAIAACSFVVQGQTLLERIVGTPTGKNGYEEYLMAADLVSGDDFAKAMETLSGGETQTFLQASRALRDRFGRALELVRAGSAKAVADPRSGYGLTTELPEFSLFRSLGRLFLADAYVHLAEGRSEAAAKDLADCIEFGGCIQTTTAISVLVGASIQNGAYAEVRRRGSGFSIQALRTLQQVERKLSNLESPVRAALRTELDFILRFAEEALSGKSSVDDFSDPNNPAYDVLRRVQSAPATRKQAFLGGLRSALKGFEERLDRMLARPVGEWRELSPPEWSDPDVEAVLTLMTDINRLVKRFAVQEVRCRLLSAYCAVLEYKWNHDNLPPSLAAMPDPGAVSDLMSDGLLGYERRGSEFEVYSRGSDLTGPIRLSD